MPSPVRGGNALSLHNSPQVFVDPDLSLPEKQHLSSKPNTKTFGRTVTLQRSSPNTSPGRSRAQHRLDPTGHQSRTRRGRVEGCQLHSHVSSNAVPKSQHKAAIPSAPTNLLGPYLLSRGKMEFNDLIPSHLSRITLAHV